MRYKVAKLAAPMKIDADWGKPEWSEIEALAVNRCVGREPEHFPRTLARVAYDVRALYVIFRVEDRYVRAVARKHQDRVCSDSCVEFFFCPGTDLTGGYFNVEMNCGGTMLFHFQTVPRQGAVNIPDSDLRQMRVAHSMPRIVEREIAEPVTWIVEYDLPFSILGMQDAFAMPGPGVCWRANFYKCGDETSRPHWLTWAPVCRPKPDFHVPESFGVLEFA